MLAGAAFALVALLAVTWLLASSGKQGLTRTPTTSRSPEVTALGDTPRSGEGVPAPAVVASTVAQAPTASSSAAPQAVATAPSPVARPTKPRGNVTTEARPAGSPAPPISNAARKSAAAAGDPDFGY